jgi:hypothetical protein
LIWLFLLGSAHFLSGHFSPVEIAMTIGIAFLTGIAVGLRWRTGTRPIVGLGTVLLFGLLQLLVFRISLLRPASSQ